MPVPKSCGDSAARKESYKPMALSEEEKARIRDEELARLQARKELKRRGRPRLVIWAVSWTIFLLGLVLASPHLHF